MQKRKTENWQRRREEGQYREEGFKERWKACKEGGMEVRRREGEW